MPDNEVIINGKVYDISEAKGMSRLLKALCINLSNIKGDSDANKQGTNRASSKAS